ncbi:hypothetical protein Ac2012v2_007116 [Leucoagaricus gongylophorus]
MSSTFMRCLVLVLTVASTATAQASFPQLNALVSRQTTSGGLDPSTLPTRCQSPCLPVNALSNGTCVTVACTCDTQISTGLQSCLQCLLNIFRNSGEVSMCQSIYDTYAQNCDSAGHTVPNFTCVASSSGSGEGSSASGDSSSSSGATLVTPTQSSVQTSANIDSSTSSGATSAAPTQSSPLASDTGTSDSGNSEGDGASGTATDSALQSSMSGILVLIGITVITIAVSLA